MPDFTPAEGRRVTRITCVVNQRYSAHAAGQLQETGMCSGFVQSGRCVRQFIRARHWGLPGNTSEIQESPMSIYRLTVSPEEALELIPSLVKTLEPNIPGRGSIFAQDAIEYRHSPAEARTQVAGHNAGAPMSNTGIFRDLALITAILSEPGSGEQFSRTALEFGTGVPLITLGSGTGIRNRLGLLRITIPPEKEIVQLIVPAHDANGVLRLLIESTRIDRPGGGFVYQTPVAYGITDPLIRIGRQQHAASIEQIIAALDEIKKGTAWRKRFCMDESRTGDVRGILRNHREIFFVCAEGGSTALVAAAMQAGGGGATITRAGRVTAGAEEDIAAREQGVICVPPDVTQDVVAAILKTADDIGDSTCVVQVMEAPAAFAYRRENR